MSNMPAERIGDHEKKLAEEAEKKAAEEAAEAEADKKSTKKKS